MSTVLVLEGGGGGAPERLLGYRVVHLVREHQIQLRKIVENYEISKNCEKLGSSITPPPPPALQPASGGLLFSAMPVMHGVFHRH